MTLVRAAMVLAVLAASLTLAGDAWAHGGGLDGLGCHHDHKRGGYHCHRGPLAGQSFESKEDALKALQQQEKLAPK